jgi:hypothetical protein
MHVGNQCITDRVIAAGLNPHEIRQLSEGSAGRGKSGLITAGFEDFSLGRTGGRRGSEARGADWCRPCFTLCTAWVDEALPLEMAGEDGRAGSESTPDRLPGPRTVSVVDGHGRLLLWRFAA